MPAEIDPKDNKDKEAGKFEKVGQVDVGERDPKSGRMKKPPTASDVAKAIKADWHAALCYGNETAGIVMVDTMTGDVFIVREERNGAETPSYSERRFCLAKALSVRQAAPHVNIVGGFHTHPSRGSTTEPSTADEKAMKPGSPELISNGKRIEVHGG